MSNWWKKTIILIPLIVAAFKIRSPQAIAIDIDLLFGPIPNLHSADRHQNPLLVAQNSSTCQQLSSQYAKVYAFETQSFYISICQTEDNYFYYRQSKLKPQETLLLPANIVFGGDVYQAVDGKTIYFVGMDDSGYYSSVMYNNNEIVFEPELKSPSTRLAGMETSSPSTKDLKINNSSSNIVSTLNTKRLQLSLDENNTDLQTQICTQDRTDINPNFKGWQGFIGKSPKIASEYAADNGHNFTYYKETPKQALIETTDGLVVDLNIATVSETVRRVCVDRIVSREPQY